MLIVKFMSYFAHRGSRITGWGSHGMGATWIGAILREFSACGPAVQGVSEIVYECWRRRTGGGECSRQRLRVARIRLDRRIPHEQ